MRRSHTYRLTRLVSIGAETLRHFSSADIYILYIIIVRRDNETKITLYTHNIINVGGKKKQRETKTKL